MKTHTRQHARIISPLLFAMLCCPILCCFGGWALWILFPRPSSGRCEPLPEGFQERDLIGTWQMQKIRGQITHTLILRADRTYRYIYENTMDHYYRYESPWNPWYLEHRPNRLAYLHLIEMRNCYYANCGWELDKRGEVKIGLGDTPVYDHCEQRPLFDIGRKIILSVTGSTEFEQRYGPVTALPRRILLWHLYAYESGIGSPYILISEAAEEPFPLSPTRARLPPILQFQLDSLFTLRSKRDPKFGAQDSYLHSQLKVAIR